MTIRTRLKKAAENVPVPVGRVLSAVPFSWRFGAAYGRAMKLASDTHRASSHDVRAWALPRLQEVLQQSYRNCLFYRTIYQRNKYNPERLSTIEHFQDVPIVGKSDMREFSLEERSLPSSGRMRINTGGTSGEPLAFYVDRGAFAREWAHMHLVWGRAGYHFRDTKLTLRGRNLGDRLLRFNPVHNEWMVNTYADRHAVCSALSGLLESERIAWIHGYPSIVSEFVSTIAEIDRGAIDSLRGNLKGVLLGSEFPAQQYVEPIKRILGVEPTAWYGHSEMCVLAYEDRPNRYLPLHSYGFVEAVEDGGDGSRLIGTSYWNMASPFIRYDSGDRISSKENGGLLRAFSITSGRVGDFVVDKGGARIALTALIFGRHHPAFDNVRHVQVRQSIPGRMDLLVVPQDGKLTPDEVMSGFDFSNVNLDVVPVLIDEPFRTTSGKIRLLVE